MCGVEAVVAGVEVGPGVGAVEAAVDAGPRVLRQARVSVVLDPGVGLGRHVLHLLKKYFIKQGKKYFLASFSHVLVKLITFGKMHF